jgi:hypothetical protein
LSCSAKDPICEYQAGFNPPPRGGLVFFFGADTERERR